MSSVALSPTQLLPALHGNVFFEDLSRVSKGVEWVVPNNIKHKRKTLDECVNQLIIALQAPNRAKGQDGPNIIINEKVSILVHDKYDNATQNINKNNREEANDGLVIAPNGDGEDVLCLVHGNVNNIKDEKENTCCGIDVPQQEKNAFTRKLSASVVRSTNLSDSSDEESSPKKSRLFTFADSDLPDSDEINEILMSYPKSTVIESSATSHSESESEDESHRFLRRRRRKKTKPVTKVDLSQMKGIEKLPKRIITRVRRPNAKLQTADELSKKQSARMFQSSYLKVQEGNMDENIIVENIIRVKSFKTTESTIHKSRIKEKLETTSLNNTDNKSIEHIAKQRIKGQIKESKRKGAQRKCKTMALKNNKLKNNTTKVEGLDSITAAKGTNRMSTSMQFIECLCMQHKNDNKKTVNTRQFANKKDRSKLSEIEGKLSKRQQKATVKYNNPVKSPISILKKRKRALNVYISSSSSVNFSESAQILKRSLVDATEVPSQIRTRSFSKNHNGPLQTPPAKVIKLQYVRRSTLRSKNSKHDKLGVTKSIFGLLL